MRATHRAGKRALGWAALGAAGLVAGCSAAGNTWVKAGYDAKATNAVKRVAVLGWAPPEMAPVGALLGTVAADRIKLRMNYLVYDSGAMRRGWSDACGPTAGAAEEAQTEEAHAEEAQAGDAQGEEAQGDGAQNGEPASPPIEGVLSIRALEIISGADGKVDLALVGELHRCSDGALLWRTEGRDATAGQDDDLTELTRAYVEKLGPEVEAYAAPAFLVIRDMLETLPDVTLDDDEVMEKIELSGPGPGHRPLPIASFLGR